jgi:hypothetical protein
MIWDSNPGSPEYKTSRNIYIPMWGVIPRDLIYFDAMIF